MAIDVPQRTVTLRCVGKAGRGAAEWVRFSFPPGCEFTDGLVAPALTLQPGVELELLPSLDKMEHKRAPGDGYLPVFGDKGKFVQRCEKAPKEVAPAALASPAASSAAPAAAAASSTTSAAATAAIPAPKHHSLQIPKRPPPKTTTSSNPLPAPAATTPAAPASAPAAAAPAAEQAKLAAASPAAVQLAERPWLEPEGV